MSSVTPTAHRSANQGMPLFEFRPRTNNSQGNCVRAHKLLITAKLERERVRKRKKKKEKSEKRKSEKRGEEREERKEKRKEKREKKKRNKKIQKEKKKRNEKQETRHKSQETRNEKQETRNEMKRQRDKERSTKAARHGPSPPRISGEQEIDSGVTTLADMTGDCRKHPGETEQCRLTANTPEVPRCGWAGKLNWAQSKHLAPKCRR